MTTKMMPKTLAEMWEIYGKEVIEAVKSGALDPEIKKIAIACFDRRDALKEDPELRVVGLDIRNEEPPKWYEVRTEMKEAIRPYCWACGIEFDSKSDFGNHLQKHHSTPEAKKKPVPATKPVKKRGLKRPVSDTFRFVDGHLYNKADVRGEVFQLPNHPGCFAQIVGCGDKSAKVRLVMTDGKHGWIPITDKRLVPKEYWDVNGVDGIKDPVFMSLKVIQDVIDSIQPVQEN
jgi:hypothetical protein